MSHVEINSSRNTYLSLINIVIFPDIGSVTLQLITKQTQKTLYVKPRFNVWNITFSRKTQDPSGLFPEKKNGNECPREGRTLQVEGNFIQHAYREDTFFCGVPGTQKASCKNTLYEMSPLRKIGIHRVL